MSEQNALFRRISALDFSIWELHIFLDTHPGNSNALKKYTELTDLRAALAEEYMERFGPLEKPLPSGKCWEWTKSPWPWEPTDLKGED